MQLTEHRNEQRLFVRQADPARVVVIDREFRRSIVLSAQRVIEDFPAKAVTELDQLAITRILEHDPEVVLLGTGANTQFAPPAITAEFLKRGIGVECMDNAAAARTFNVLVGENRRAVAVFFLSGQQEPA